MRVIDLYCGVGGLSYGFMKVFGNVTGYDKELWCVANYRKNVSKSVYKVDLLSYTPDTRADIIIGGSPCEPFSQLNITSTKYEKHPLYPTLPRFFRIVKRLRPIVFVHENVPKASFHVTKAISEANLVEEYRIAKIRVRYSDYGVGTSRERLFTIGVLRNQGSPVDIIEELRKYREKGKTLLECIRDLVDKPMDESINHVWRMSNRKGNGVLFSFQVNLRWDEPLKGFGNPEKSWVWLPDGSRVISVRELMRCMGFPDNFILIRSTPLRTMYEMITDAVSPIFSEKLAKAISEVI